ncbi:MAG TPA: hypothetical protein VFD69_12695 [Vicinamibacterales bacterium]|nr:hypothetical protein [Vicinamibacterales bacterium]
MTMSTRLAVAAAALLLALPAHPAAQNREHQQQAAELRILQEQQQQLTLAISQLADAIKALNTRLDEASAATRKGFADQELGIRNMSGDLSAIRERTQETDTRIRTLRDEIDALRTTISSLPSLISQAAPPPTDGVDPAAVAGGRPQCRPRLRSRQARRPRQGSRRRACSSPPSPTTSPARFRWRFRASKR